MILPVFRTFQKTSLNILIFNDWFLKMGVASYICICFLRKLKNRSGSISIQIIAESCLSFKNQKQKANCQISLHCTKYNDIIGANTNRSKISTKGT